MQLFDAYGALWLAITAAIGIAYLHSPAMKAVEEHEWREIEKWRESIPSVASGYPRGATCVADSRIHSSASD